MAEISEQYIESYLAVRGRLEDQFDDNKRIQLFPFDYSDLAIESIAFYNWFSSIGS